MKENSWRQGGLLLTLSGDEDPEFRSEIHDQIKAFNDVISEPHRQARRDGVQPLHIMLRDKDGALKGGLVAATYWDWLDLDDFWLDESFRRQGIGSCMLQAAEIEAVARGCRSAKVETFSFQACDFYKKYGYRVVGELKQYPPGQSFFWMQKDFA